MTHGQPAEGLVSAEARRVLARAIADAEGNEVFAAGYVDAAGEIHAVKIVARGNAVSVPVVLQAAYECDLILHNHPTGDLTPSAADLSVASHLAENGVGFAIVNNEASRIYKVIEAFDDPAPDGWDVEQLVETLGLEGPLAARKPDYTPRPGQQAMLREVAESLGKPSISLIEAGTGVGKSFAYLIPAIKLAETQKSKVVLSTQTINLQQQLIDKDIPFLLDALNSDVKAALVKGRSNYACLRKLHQAAEEKSLFADDSQALFREMLSFAQTAAKTGSREEFGQLPDPTIWNRVQSETDTTLRQRCPHFQDCFYYKARRKMMDAQLLVVNHHVLCADIATRHARQNYSLSAVLPPYQHVVVDEAHTLEDSATSYFGFKLSLAALRRQIGVFYRQRQGRDSGALVKLLAALEVKAELGKSKAAASAASLIRDRLLPELNAILVSAEAFFTGLETVPCVAKFLASDESSFRQRPRELDAKLSAHYNSQGIELEAALDLALISSERLSELMSTLSEDDDWESLEGEWQDTKALRDRLQARKLGLKAFLATDLDENVYYLEKMRQRDSLVLSLNMLPIELGPLLREAIFEPLDHVLMTSATLTINQRFGFVRHRLGLETPVDTPEGAKDPRESVVDSPFDYATQAVFAVPVDMPEPQHPSFGRSSVEAMEAICRVTQGSTFLLFSSYTALRAAAHHLQSLNLGLRLLVQGQMDRHELLRRFQDDPGSILLGTDSFWQGVDVPGEALRCVVLAKLPFRSPGEPLQQARSERIEKRGGRPFFELSLPDAVMRLKQGFGRLIRTQSDRGMVICLDTRLLRKGYGRTFLDSLPPAEKLFAPLPEVVSRLKTFY